MKKTQLRAAETIISSDYKMAIGNKTYSCGRPTIMTMIEVSRLINLYPSVDIDKGNEVNQMFRIAQNAEPLGMIIATLITGYEKGTLRSIYINLRRKYLARYILNHHTNSEISNALIELLSRLEIADFFGITTSLSVINLTKKTKEVD